MNNSEELVKTLEKGGVAIFPTDTAIGIGCRADNAESVRRVFEIKKRALDNAVLVLVSSIEMAERYVEIPDDVREKLINKYWPGGLSIFFKCKEGKVLGIVTADSNILAVRLPAHKEIVSVIEKVGVPIVATSANISGEETPYTIDEVDDKMKEEVDFVLPGECTYKQESTIVDTTVTPWKTIRTGAVKI